MDKTIPNPSSNEQQIEGMIRCHFSFNRLIKTGKEYLLQIDEEKVIIYFWCKDELLQPFLDRCLAISITIKNKLTLQSINFSLGNLL